MTDHPDLPTFELFTMGSLENDEAFVAHVARCEACSATLVKEARLELLLNDVAARPRDLRTIVRLSLPFAALAVAAAALLAARGATPSDGTASTATASRSAASSSGSAASSSASTGDDDEAPDVRLVDAALSGRGVACLEAGAAKDPGMAGRVGIEVTIAPDGLVSRSIVARNEGLPDEVAQCVAAVYRKATFPPRGRPYTHHPEFVYVKRPPKP